MKELSIEEKAKAYDEAFERARDYYKANLKLDKADENMVLEDIFPELVESEDERIREWIIDDIRYNMDNEPLNNSEYKKKAEKAIAWLEKQGEQMTVDKIEPKFKSGDWVVCNNGSHPIFQVIECSWPNAKYRNIEGTEIFLNANTLEKQYHLFTIQDAKDGDVLAYRDGQWIFIYKEKVDDNSFYYHTLYSTIHQDLTINNSAFTLLGDAIIPATKEQRNLLFQKMKESGYEWDANKNELKLLITNGGDFFESENCEQNPAWSEEDERAIGIIKIALEHPYDMEGKWDRKFTLDWLKSLKERVQPQWKPSDEQMDALQYVYRNLNPPLSDKLGWNSLKTLELMFEQLKKLKE